VVRFPTGVSLAIRADGRDPADLVLPGFRQQPDGLWVSPGSPGTGRRIDLKLLPGIGRFEAQPFEGGSATTSLLAPRPSGITPTL
jgi:hypothetical protein